MTKKIQNHTNWNGKGDLLASLNVGVPIPSKAVPDHSFPGVLALTVPRVCSCGVGSNLIAWEDLDGSRDTWSSASEVVEEAGGLFPYGSPRFLRQRLG